MNSTTTPTLEEVRAKLIELPDATMEEFAELLHRIHSCADQLLSVGEFKYELREEPDHSVRRVIGRLKKTS